MIVVTIPSMIIFIWCSINGFGADAVKLFESIHPSGGLSIIENMDKSTSFKLLGALIDTFYSAIDSFIAGFAFSGLYNLFISKFEK